MLPKELKGDTLVLMIYNTVYVLQVREWYWAEIPGRKIVELLQTILEGLHLCS